MTRDARRASALRHGYLVKDPALNAALRLRDAWLRTSRARVTGGVVRHPRRLLICVGGHLGDAVVATSVLPVLRSSYGEVEIGVLAPSWSLRVFDGHPQIRWRHALDHWKTNRFASAAGRWIAYRRSTQRAVAELRDVGYDTAVDLYPFFPNAAGTLSAAAIPTRIGYTSGGGGPLYTHALDWRDTARHTAEQHAALLHAFLPDLRPYTPRYDLPPLDAATEERGRAITRSLGIAGAPYVVLHPGAGDSRKQWPAPRWRALVDRLREHGSGVRFVFTGAGEAESKLIEEIRDGDDALITACGRTAWDELRYLLANSSLVIGADSAAVHLAAAHDVPCVAIMAAMSDPAHWRPLGTRASVVTSPVPCAPCFRSRGCTDMRCVRGVTVDSVERAIRTLVGARG